MTNSTSRAQDSPTSSSTSATTDVAVYAASLQEWTVDPDVPLETATG